jgi:2-oxoglutarate ferredoxin oxidoreductase subunit alpha
VLAIPLTELARKAGGTITANTVAAGACLSLLGAPITLFEEVIARQFSGKPQQVIEENLKAARLGYDAVRGVKFTYSFEWTKGEPRGLLLTGDQAFALGALAGDCRFVAFYPMSPSTSINQQLASAMEQFPLVVEQAEDEIAAMTMVVGASFAGVRAMTATSGGGFCLMTEGLGLAGMTETPVVVVNAQRPGPATGLPTRTGQADLQFIIHAAQDEFPRFVFAPGTPEQAFETMARAFQLADKYQVPAIVLADQYLIDSLYLTTEECEVPEKVERFVLGPQEEGEALHYKRYAFTFDGVSPRALPCRGKTLVVGNGNEHREDGHITEDVTERNNMVTKRMAKVPHMLAELRPPLLYPGKKDTLLVCWGSTRGAAQEVVEVLTQEGREIALLHFADLWPFPAAAVREILNYGARVIIVEQNSTGQLAQLIRQETGCVPAEMILKYDGRPFYVDDLLEQVRKVMR